MLLTISGQASEDVIARIDKKLRKSVPEKQDAVENMVSTAKHLWIEENESDENHTDRKQGEQAGSGSV